MRVEFWPSTKTERADCYMSVELHPDTVDFLMGLGSGLLVQSSFSVSSQTRASGFRYRIKSPVLLLTVCQSKTKKIPELQQVVNILKDGADLLWEMRTPTDEWEENPEKEEIPS